MVTSVTPLPTPFPDIDTQTRDEFNANWSKFFPGLQITAANIASVGTEVSALALNAEASAGGIANLAWVSGTTYAAGNVRYSPIDFFNYRRKTAGAGTTDPSADSTNWALLTKTGSGGADTTSSAVDIVLTALSGRLQIISTTAPSKKVMLPSAITLSKGASLFVIKNSGIYRLSVHKNSGGFICYIHSGQVVSLSCSDITTADGIWYAGGQNVELIYDGNTAEVVNAVDSRNIAVAMLSSTKAICVFRNNATGFLWGVILNYGASSGTPAAINAEASEYLSIAAQTSTQATVAYKTSAGVTKGYVLNVSTNTITPGTVATIDSVTGAGTYTAVVVLTSAKLLCAYNTANAGTVRERVLDIASSVITPSAEVVADVTTKQPLAHRVELGVISATKAILAFKTAAAASVTLRIQTISVSTPAPAGSALVVNNIGSGIGIAYSLVVLSTDRAILIHSSDLAYSDLVVALLDISGTTPILLCKKKSRLNITDSAFLRATRFDQNNVYVTWNGAGSGGIDAVTVKITSGDRILIGNLSERIETGVTAAEGYVDCVALDSTHVMQVCRNVNTFLSAKTVEIVV